MKEAGVLDRDPLVINKSTAMPCGRRAGPSRDRGKRAASKGRNVTEHSSPDGKTPDIKLPDPVELSRSMAEIADRSQRLVTEFLQRQQQPENGVGMADPLNIGAAFFEMTARMMADPARLVQAQLSLWSDYMDL